MLPQVNQLLGILLAQRRDFSGAAAQFRNYLKLAPNGPEAATVRTQLDEVEKMAATTAVKQDPEKEK